MNEIIASRGHVFEQYKALYGTDHCKPEEDVCNLSWKVLQHCKRKYFSCEDAQRKLNECNQELKEANSEPWSLADYLSDVIPYRHLYNRITLEQDLNLALYPVAIPSRGK